ncbi:hypothetical protein HY251_05575 [bacterium]|nr:hypothetical protein [bacterium]
MRAAARPSRIVLLLAFLLGGAVVFAQSTPPRESPDAPPEPAPALTPPSAEEGLEELVDAKTRASIDAGLAWLAARQHRSGQWHTSTGRFDMSVTSVAGLAFLAHGEVPGEGKGKYGVVLTRAIDWVLDHQRPVTDTENAGLFFDQREIDQQDRLTHGHGFAMLFLAEAYGQSSSPALRKRMRTALEQAVKLTELSQSQDGGWFYHPRDKYRDEGSTTIVLIQGLRAARNAGILVPHSVIEKAVKYVHDSQNTSGPQEGGVRYTVKRGEASPALTAAGVSVYYGAGEYDSPGITNGFRYLDKNLQINDRQHFWFYTQFYAVQAYNQKGGADWHGYLRKLKRSLLPGGIMGQGFDGAWNDPYGGPAFGTAVAVLCLEVPLQYLPIFQR